MGKQINTILTLTDRFSGKLGTAGAKAAIFKAQLSTADKATKKINDGFNKLGKVAVAGAGLATGAIVGLGKSSIQAYGDFQSSMDAVAGTMAISKTSDTYKQLENAARDAGKKTTKTAKESAEALNYMALAGWSSQQSMQGLMPILRASEASGGDLATVSDLTTDSLSALGKTAKDSERYLDIMSKAQSKSNMTLLQGEEAMVAVGGTFNTFGTSMEEGTALLGVLANRGIKGAEAGNSLQSTLVNLTKKSGESYKAMSALGISAYDSSGKFKGVSAVLKELNQKTKGLTEEQRNTYLTMIGGKNQLTTLNALMQGLNTTTEDGRIEFDALQSDLENSNGALNQLATTMTSNFAGASARANSAVDDLKLTIGKRIEPYLTKFLDWFANKLPTATEKVDVWLGQKLPVAVNTAKSWFNQLLPVGKFLISHFKQIATVGVSVGAGFKAFTVLTSVSKTFMSITTAIKGAKTALTLGKVASMAFNTSLLACPITWIAVGIGAAVAGFITMYKHSEQFREGCNVLWDKVKGFGSFLAGEFVGVFNTVKSAFSLLSPSLSYLGGAFGRLIVVCQPFLDICGKIIGFGLHLLFTKVKIAITAVGLAFAGLCTGLGVVINLIATGLKPYMELVKLGMGAIKNVVGEVKTAFMNWLSPTIERFKKVGKWIEKVKSAIKNFKLPEWLGGNGGGGESGSTKHNATGTQYYGGGWTTINEHGEELVNLPSGTKIYPASASKKILNNSNTQNSTIIINVYGDNYGDSGEVVGDKVARKILRIIQGV